MNYTLIVANWKLNPESKDEAKKLARRMRNLAKKLSKTEVIICPPFVFMSSVSAKDMPDRFHLGAQSVAAEESGPHTGLVSAGMLKDIGAEYVIVGHSEERARGINDDEVAKRAKTVLDAGMTPIICVGERVREESGAHYDIVKDQIQKSCALIPKSHSRDVIIAYEPIWAIGAVEAMKPEEIYEMSLFLKKVFADSFGTDSALKLQVLYGGAVTFRNAADILRVGKVDGLLVGRESLNSPAFISLIKAVEAL